VDYCGNLVFGERVFDDKVGRLEEAREYLEGVIEEVGVRLEGEGVFDVKEGGGQGEEGGEIKEDDRQEEEE
jgi:hypothetical protein